MTQYVSSYSLLPWLKSDAPELLKTEQGVLQSDSLCISEFDAAGQWFMSCSYLHAISVCICVKYFVLCHIGIFTISRFVTRSDSKILSVTCSVYFTMIGLH